MQGEENSAGGFAVHGEQQDGGDDGVAAAQEPLSVKVGSDVGPTGTGMRGSRSRVGWRLLPEEPGSPRAFDLTFRIAVAANGVGET